MKIIYNYHHQTLNLLFFCLIFFLFSSCVSSHQSISNENIHRQETMLLNTTGGLRYCRGSTIDVFSRTNQRFYNFYISQNITNQEIRSVVETVIQRDVSRFFSTTFRLQENITSNTDLVISDRNNLENNYLGLYVHRSNKIFLDLSRVRNDVNLLKTLVLHEVGHCFVMKHICTSREEFITRNDCSTVGVGTAILNPVLSEGLTYYTDMDSLELQRIRFCNQSR